MTAQLARSRGLKIVKSTFKNVLLIDGSRVKIDPRYEDICVRLKKECTSREIIEAIEEFELGEDIE